jgi:hypothetical protein
MLMSLESRRSGRRLEAGCTSSGRQVTVETEFVRWRLIRVGASCHHSDGANYCKVASRKANVKQSWTGLEGSRKLRLQDFKTVDT